MQQLVQEATLTWSQQLRPWPADQMWLNQSNYGTNLLGKPKTRQHRKRYAGYASSDVIYYLYSRIMNERKCYAGCLSNDVLIIYIAESWMKENAMQVAYQMMYYAMCLRIMLISARIIANTVHSCSQYAVYKFGNNIRLLNPHIRIMLPFLTKKTPGYQAWHMQVKQCNFILKSEQEYYKRRTDILGGSYTKLLKYIIMT